MHRHFCNFRGDEMQAGRDGSGGRGVFLRFGCIMVKIKLQIYRENIPLPLVRGDGIRYNGPTLKRA